MERLWAGLALANDILAWTVVIWFAGGTVWGAVSIACDEWRFHRNRAKSEAVRAYADQLEAAHGGEAFRFNCDAIHDARLAKHHDRYRFLRQVSAELIVRRVSRSAVPD